MIKKGNLFFFSHMLCNVQKGMNQSITQPYNSSLKRSQLAVTISIFVAHVFLDLSFTQKN